MADLYQLAEGESVPFKFLVSKTLAGDQATVRSSHPEAASVQIDATPLPGCIASGTVRGGKVPMSAAAIQGTVTHADNTTSTAVFLLDVGGGTPAPPKPAPPPEPIRAHLTLGPSMASKAADKKPAPVAPIKTDTAPEKP